MAQNEAQHAIGGDVCLYSRYVWRGLVFDEDPVLQMDVWTQARGLTLTFWGNMDLTDEEGNYQGQFNEWDTYIDFNIASWGPASFGGGLYYLNFPSSSGQEGSTTAELSAWIAGNVVGSPTLTLYWDIWQHHGIYANFSLWHGLDLGPGQLSMSTGLGWGNENHNVQSGVPEASGWLDVQANISYSLPVHRLVMLTPAVSYCALLQDEIRRSYGEAGIKSEGFFASLSAAVVVGR